MKNIDKNNRGYLLNQIIKKMDPQIWQKIPIQFFIKKFVDLNKDYSNSELVDAHALDLLKEMIQANYDADQ